MSKVDDNILAVYSPVVRLRSQVSEWEEMGAIWLFFQLIKMGYKIPYKTGSQSALLRNNNSALNDKGNRKFTERRCILKF